MRSETRERFGLAGWSPFGMLHWGSPPVPIIPIIRLLRFLDRQACWEQDVAMSATQLPYVPTCRSL